MSVKVNANNIFASLQDDSDNEAPVVKKAPVAKADTKPATGAPAQKETATRGAGRGDRKPAAEGEQQPRQRKEYRGTKDQRDGPKPKGVSGQPHPQDRHSGTGVPAYERKFRKEGGGRHNYGTVKNEVDAINKDEPAKTTEAVVEPVVEAPVVEEPVVVDNTITVEEYFKRLGVTAEEPVKEAPKRELNHDELKRDKLQVVVSKTEKVLDANVTKAQKKKGNANTTYLLGCNTDHSELLGVKTGQVAVKFVEGEKKTDAPAPAGRPARENNKPAHTNAPTKHHKKVNVDNETDFPKLA